MTLPQSLENRPAPPQQPGDPRLPRQLPAIGTAGFCLLAGEHARLVASDEVAKELLGRQLFADSTAAKETFLEHFFSESFVFALYKRAWDQLNTGQMISDTGLEPLKLTTNDIAASPRHAPERPLTLSFRPLAGGADRWVLMSVQPAGEASPARRDSLTNLPDRQQLAWQVSQFHDQSYALLFIDLNDFKQVNDQHGHAAGDAVLRTIAANWQACVRDNDLLVRYGGDEFVLLLPGISRIEDVEPVIHRLQQAAAEPIEYDGAEFHLSAAIGAAIGRVNKTPLEEVLAEADRAMYANKP